MKSNSRLSQEKLLKFFFKIGLAKRLMEKDRTYFNKSYLKMTKEDFARINVDKIISELSDEQLLEEIGICLLLPGFIIAMIIFLVAIYIIG